MILGVTDGVTLGVLVTLGVILGVAEGDEPGELLGVFDGVALGDFEGTGDTGLIGPITFDPGIIMNILIMVFGSLFDE